MNVLHNKAGRWLLFAALFVVFLHGIEGSPSQPTSRTDHVPTKAPATSGTETESNTKSSTDDQGTSQFPIIQKIRSMFTTTKAPITSLSSTAQSPRAGSTDKRPDAGNTGNVPADEGTGKRPADEGTGKTPADEGTGNVPADDRTGKTPADEGTGNVPADDRTGKTPADEGTGKTPDASNTDKGPIMDDQSKGDERLRAFRPSGGDKSTKGPGLEEKCKCSDPDSNGCSNRAPCECKKGYISHKKRCRKACKTNDDCIGNKKICYSEKNICGCGPGHHMVDDGTGKRVCKKGFGLTIFSPGKFGDGNIYFTQGEPNNLKENFPRLKASAEGMTPSVGGLRMEMFLDGTKIWKADLNSCTKYDGDGTCDVTEIVMSGKTNNIPKSTKGLCGEDERKLEIKVYKKDEESSSDPALTEESKPAQTDPVVVTGKPVQTDPVVVTGKPAQTDPVVVTGKPAQTDPSVMTGEPAPAVENEEQAQTEEGEEEPIVISQEPASTGESEQQESITEDLQPQVETTAFVMCQYEGQWEGVSRTTVGSLSSRSRSPQTAQGVDVMVEAINSNKKMMTQMVTPDTPVQVILRKAGVFRLRIDPVPGTPYPPPVGGPGYFLVIFVRSSVTSKTETGSDIPDFTSSVIYITHKAASDVRKLSTILAENVADLEKGIGSHICGEAELVILFDPMYTIYREKNRYNNFISIPLKVDCSKTKVAGGCSVVPNLLLNGDDSRLMFRSFKKLKDGSQQQISTLVSFDDGKIRRPKKHAFISLENVGFGLMQLLSKHIQNTKKDGKSLMLPAVIDELEADGDDVVPFEEEEEQEINGVVDFLEKNLDKPDDLKEQAAKMNKKSPVTPLLKRMFTELADFHVRRNVEGDKLRQYMTCGQFRKLQDDESSDDDKLYAVLVIRCLVDTKSMKNLYKTYREKNKGQSGNRDWKKNRSPNGLCDRELSPAIVKLRTICKKLEEPCESITPISDQRKQIELYKQAANILQKKGKALGLWNFREKLAKANQEDHCLRDYLRPQSRQPVFFKKDENKIMAGHLDLQNKNICWKTAAICRCSCTQTDPQNPKQSDQYSEETDIPEVEPPTEDEPDLEP